MEVRTFAKGACTLPEDGEQIAFASAAGLHYATDCLPGIRRRRRGNAFAYVRDDGEPLTEADRARIRALVIPPAWTDVWIAEDSEAHLQVTGRDARGRKQYRYHPRWREVRDETKYSRMSAFGEALPHIRARVAEDLRRHALSRERVLAVAVALLDETLIRVGNPEYRDANCSYGLTTLEDDHVDVRGGRVSLRFRGKAGKEREISVDDAKLARAVKRMRDLPGQEVFQYLDDSGTPRVVGSQDVNGYIASVGVGEFTSKDFRTWGGTVAVAQWLVTAPAPSSRRVAERHVVAAVKHAADHLGNTPAVCRRSYVHPRVIDAYLDGSFGDAVSRLSSASDEPGGLRAEERLVLELVRDR